MVATGYVSTTGDPRKVDVAGETMTGDLVLNDSTPDTANSAASKSYVDSVAGGVPDAHAASHADGGSDEVTLTESQITGLTASLAGKVSTAGGTMTGPLVVLANMSVIRPDGAGGYQVRVTGGAVDYDYGPTDLVVGRWSDFSFEQGFHGTQTATMRWRDSGITIAESLEVGANVYGATHTLNGATGVAELGAKNSLSNVRIVGRRATPGPPTTGTWVAGDSAQDSRGTWHLCTAGGTPGTWTGGTNVESGYVSSGVVTLPASVPWIGVVGLSSFPIAASVGDRLIFQASFMAILTGVNFLDCAVMVGGSPVRYGSSGTGTAATEGDPVAYRDTAGAVVRGLAPFTFVVEAGDLSGGNVTFGVVHRGAGTTTNVYASTAYPFRWVARNDGPA